MDSVTQIILGAAVGEVVLGKKAGNRAMLWGAVAGTVPDLDIIANFVTDEMTALAFHRGLTHSLFFAVLAPFAYAYFVHRIYAKGWNRSKNYRALGAVFWVLTVLVFMGLMNFVPVMASGNISMTMVGITVVIFSIFAWLIYNKYYKKDPEPIEVSYREWVILFFWATVTHPLLDCCTAFGTQFFQPFSDYRVAWNNISVADPIYTLPFLICVIVASVYTRKSKWRSIINWVGIGISSAYLLFGVYHKLKLDNIVESSMAEKGIAYDRFTTNPTILNNFLWNVVVEDKDQYYHSQFSFFDRPQKLGKLRRFPKNHHLLDQYEGDRSYEILKWFSNDYFNIIRRRDGKLQFNDMRYGTYGDLEGKEEDYIFKFIIEEKDGVLHVEQSRDAQQDIGSTFQALIDRIKGEEVDLSAGFKKGPEQLE